MGCYTVQFQLVIHTLSLVHINYTFKQVHVDGQHLDAQPGETDTTCTVHQLQYASSFMITGISNMYTAYKATRQGVRNVTDT